MTGPQRFARSAATVAAACAAALLSACAGGSPYSPTAFGSNGGGGKQSNCTMPLPPAGTEIIGVDLSTTCTDTTYQEVVGYFVGTTQTSGQVLGVTRSASDVIEFKNVDVQPHTAADLGAWTGSYPQNGPDPAATPSPAGADIAAAGFTTGNLNPGGISKKYVADVPGLYIFGCAYHYAPTPGGMRTVIIVQ